VSDLRSLGIDERPLLSYWPTPIKQPLFRSEQQLQQLPNARRTPGHFPIAGAGRTQLISQCSHSRRVRATR